MLTEKVEKHNVLFEIYLECMYLGLEFLYESILLLILCIDFSECFYEGCDKIGILDRLESCIGIRFHEIWEDLFYLLRDDSYVSLSIIDPIK